VFSTSTRNFDNRMGNDARVFLGSAELAAVVTVLGRIPSPEVYMSLYREKIELKKDAIYRPLDFHELER
jgi:aconitate hydratase 2/2-methylisocitrate dehydratase